MSSASPTVVVYWAVGLGDFVSISWHHSTVPCLEGHVPSSKHRLFPHKLFALTTVGYSVA